MDLTSNLEELRRLIARFREREGQDTKKELGDYPGQKEECEIIERMQLDRMIDLIEALDGWITKGGFLPGQWEEQRQPGPGEVLASSALDILKSGLEAAAGHFQNHGLILCASECREILKLVERLTRSAAPEPVSEMQHPALNTEMPLLGQRALQRDQVARFHPEALRADLVGMLRDDWLVMYGEIETLMRKVEELQNRPFFMPSIVEYLRQYYPGVKGDIQAVVLSSKPTLLVDDNVVVLERVMVQILPRKERDDE
jgi:hypothetical protein